MRAGTITAEAEVARERRLRRSVLSVASLLVLSGCVTGELWGYRYRVRGSGDPMRMPPTRRRRAGIRSTLLLPILLALHGCVTPQLWGYEWRSTWNLRTKEYDHRLVTARGTQWEWWRVVLRVVATPVTLAVDGVCGIGWCLAEGMASDDEDDGVCVGSSGRSRDRHRPADPNSPVPPPPPIVAPSQRKLGKPLLSGVRR